MEETGEACGVKEQEGYGTGEGQAPWSPALMMTLVSAWTEEVRLFVSEVLQSKLVEKTGAALQATLRAVLCWGEVVLLLGGPPARKWWKWQRSLSTRALAIQAGILLGFLLLYRLRRWLARKQYGKRLSSYVVSKRRAMRRRYTYLEAWVRHKSRVAAMALPHAMFVFVFLLLAWLFPTAAAHLADDSVAAEKFAILLRVLISLIAIHRAEDLLPTALPALNRSSADANPVPVTGATADLHAAPETAISSFAARTAFMSPCTDDDDEDDESGNEGGGARGGGRRIRRREPRTPAEKRTAVASSAVREAASRWRSLHENLMFWVVFGGAVALQRSIHATVSALPFGRRVASAMGAVRGGGLAYAALLVWLQLPVIGGVPAAFHWLVPFVDRRLPAILSPLRNGTRAAAEAAMATLSVKKRPKARRGAGNNQRGNSGRSSSGNAWSPFGWLRRRDGYHATRVGGGSGNGDGDGDGKEGDDGDGDGDALGEDESRQEEEKLWVLLRALMWSGVLSTDTAETVMEVGREGWVLAIACVAFCMPFSVLTELGCIVTGLVYPAACSASAVMASSGSPSKSSSALTAAKATSLSLADVVTRAFSRRDVSHLRTEIKWLKYWVVYALAIHVGHEFHAKGLYRLILFGRHHLHLMLLVYLQLPYFRGAVRIHDAMKRRLFRLLKPSSAPAAVTSAAEITAASPVASVAEACTTPTASTSSSLDKSGGDDREGLSDAGESPSGISMTKSHGRPKKRGPNTPKQELGKAD